MSDAERPPSEARPGSGPDGPPIGVEAASWDACYEHSLPYWDLGQCSPPLLAFLRAGVLPAPGLVLLPGCGTGHELPVLERAGHAPVGVDFAPRAVAAAEERLAREGCERARVLQGDVTSSDLPLAPGSVDWVFDQTCFCALAPPLREAYVRNLARLVRHGGEVWALNMRTSFTERPPYDAAPDEVVRLFEDHGFALLERRALLEESLERRRGSETLLRFERA